MPGNDQPIPSVWTRPRPQRKPALSPERIVAEAIALLDAEGLDALSMRTLGKRLGAGATSLYRHVASKDELIELVVDELYGELEVPDPAGSAGWREAAVRMARDMRSMVLRHPWMASVLGQVGLVQLGPNVTKVAEGTLAVFRAAGFPPAEAGRAMTVVGAYVVGVAINEAAYLSMVVRSGLSERELLERLQVAHEQALKDQPNLRESRETYEAGAGNDPEQTREADFDYGLQRVLDGLQARLDEIQRP